MLTIGFINDYIPTLHNSIVKFIQPLSDEQIKNLDPSNIQEIIQNMQIIYKVYDEEKALEIYDEFSLSLALKYFKSPYLTVRLSGLNDMKNFISKVEAKKSPMHFRDRRENSWITAKYELLIF